VVFIGYKPTTIWEYDGDLMIDLGKFDHDLTVLPSPGMMGIVAETMGKSSPNGRTIQVSELL